MSGLKIWQATLASFLATIYWVVVLALPSEGGQWNLALRWSVGILGVVVGTAGIIVARRGLGEEADVKAERFALGITMMVIGVLLTVLAFMTSNEMDLSDGRRFAIGVGGAALAGFVFAVARFDTMRAAASVPVVILLIGVVVWPGASDLISDDVQEAIITWMGVILAANGVAEAVRQVGEANAKASSGDSAGIGSSGDLRSRTAAGGSGE